MKVLENLLYAYYFKKKGRHDFEALFKISLIGLLHLLYPKKEYLPKRLSEVFENGKRYFTDPTLMSFKEAIELFTACEEAIERLGYTKMESKVNVRKRILESRGASL